MPQATFHFPKGFLWGSATAAHQVEGDNRNNNWSAWENEPGRIKDGTKAGLADDWWGGRWKEDFDRAAEAGQNALRLSVEWSRIQPAADRWDEDALEHYRQMVRGLVERKMTPLVTLHHFTDPLWLYERGGWEDDEAPALFNAFVAKTVEALKEYVNLWVTINEPNIYTSMGYAIGIFPPGSTDAYAAFHVYHNLLRGHAAAYRTIHAIQSQARVGVAINRTIFNPARRWYPPDVLLTRFFNWNLNDSFSAALASGKLAFLFRRASVPEAAGTQDFIGLNYYDRRQLIFDAGARNQLYAQQQFPRGVEISPSGEFGNTPEGMFDALKWAKQFDLPIIITENGIEDEADGLRPRYLVENIHQMWRAVNFSYPIKGYFHWTLVDNFEWASGWTQRFGLWGLDLDTQVRFKRKSADLYAAICKENGLSSEMVQRYAPEVFNKLFPG
jgi:beta-glucosidase